MKKSSCHGDAISYVYSSVYGSILNCQYTYINSKWPSAKTIPVIKCENLTLTSKAILTLTYDTLFLVMSWRLGLELADNVNLLSYMYVFCKPFVFEFVMMFHVQVWVKGLLYSGLVIASVIPTPDLTQHISQLNRAPVDLEIISKAIMK